MGMVECSIRETILLATIIVLLMVTPASSQITTACTSSLISSFTPCLNFITGSTNGSGSPTSDCCNALGSLIGSSTDCACLILTGSVPFSLPINRTLAVSLPRACKSVTVPLKCKATATPVPSPGPVSYGPSLPPLPPSTGSTTTPGSEAESPSLPPSEAESPPTVANDPTNKGDGSLVLPSSAMKLSQVYSASLLPVLMLGAMLLNKF